MNKVKRLGKTSIQYQGAIIDHYKWQCCGCGTVYTLRRQAQSCTCKDYIDVSPIGMRYVHRVTKVIDFLSGDLELINEVYSAVNTLKERKDEKLLKQWGF